MRVLTLVLIIRNIFCDIICGGQDDSSGGGRHLSSCVGLSTSDRMITLPSLPSPRTQAHSFFNKFGSLFVCGGRYEILFTCHIVPLTNSLFSEDIRTVLLPGHLLTMSRAKHFIGKTWYQVCSGGHALSWLVTITRVFSW